MVYVWHDGPTGSQLVTGSVSRAGSTEPLSGGAGSITKVRRDRYQQGGSVLEHSSCKS